MIEISLCVITNNNEGTIGNCLESIKYLVDEIVVVDMGSTDGTKEIVYKYTERLFNFEGDRKKAQALNLSFEKATKDYILWMEPDDVLEEAEHEKLLALKLQIDASVDIITTLHNYISSEDGEGIISLRRNHILKRTLEVCWQSGLIEYLPVKGKQIESDIVITNRPLTAGTRRIPGVFENHLELNMTLSPRDLYYYARKLFESDLYERAGEYYEQFLNSSDGFVGDKLSACYSLAQIYNKLGSHQRELQFILKAFEYDVPRAEFCCKLGKFFLQQNELNKAMAWYKTALTLERPRDDYSFFDEDCWTWLPHLQLCICYNKLGENQKAYEHNESALKLLKGNETLLGNKKFLEDILGKEKPAITSPVVNISKSLKRPLKIVQVAPNVYPVPPNNYGGTEVVIYELTEELVRRGYDVYLYALKGSKTSAKLIPYKSTLEMDSIEIMKYVNDTLPDNVDIFHYHTHPSVISSRCISIPALCTIHGPTNAIAKNPVYVSKRAMERLCQTRGHYVYNGLDFNRYEFCEMKEDYLLFLGRIDSEKGVHHAIEVAEKTNHKLIIAGPVHDYEYYKALIEPRIKNNTNIHHIGAVGGKKKQDLLKYAKCMLFPITWEEPFGLVMTEAMACGTPVLALNYGSVPEVLCGYPELICKDTNEMIYKVLNEKLPTPRILRKYVLENFSASIMTDRYIEIYEKLIKEMS